MKDLALPKSKTCDQETFYSTSLESHTYAPCARKVRIRAAPRVGQRVEGGDGEAACRLLAQHRRQARAHLVGRGVRERHCQDGRWAQAAVGDEVLDAPGEDAGLTGPGASDDE